MSVAVAVNIVLMLLVVETMVTVVSLTVTNHPELCQPVQHGTHHQVEDVVDYWTAGQIRQLLLLISMDVETNPGPDSSEVSMEDRMVEGLAELMSQAPSPAIRNVLSCWSPSSSQSEIMKSFDKYKKAQVVETLAWLWKVETSTIKGNKDVLLKDVLTAVENLLPDHCDVCQEVYVIERGESPSLRCAGCHQGFHEPCVVTTGLIDVLPKLPGKMTWLCSHCKDSFELVTTLGNRGKPTIRSTKRLPPTLPPVIPEDEASSVDVESTAPVIEVSDEETEKRQVCQLYLKGECTHGMSGKSNGGCKDIHPKNCPVYMRWGNKLAKGCENEECEVMKESLEKLVKQMFTANARQV